MARSVIFCLLFVATNALLALLYPFSLLRLLIVVLLYAIGTAVMLYLLFHPRNQWLVANRSRVDDKNCVALTFDDGPSPADTLRLLDLLREKNVKATFFVVGVHAEQHPEIVRRARDEGHLIANHTWSHQPLFCFLTLKRLYSEIERNQETLRRICGCQSRYFRSPVGLRHPFLASGLRKAKLEYLSWSIRSFDTLIKDPDVLSRRILDRVRGGDIILLHDRLPAGTGVMLEALPGIIDELRERGLKFTLVGSREDAA